ncbi:(R)-phenoxypropionate/alpha-ketoglutarate-dioxygenase [Cyphellophora attinorum]|uniref:(R)-phenoxypropionate/alpha-ketoglutarate-dioxygenase n=1 Tax=Cyphellophora attinorum TaxID=1664694 RepID=A0A0N0NMZ0_9EURO|nr:(R)-phenoxypropionate/alpha-ketoglutarate-dioxygenase [Phialophora attinorum]KPI41011.1 (R)-phenoxypropionate/alpha-ketoglutarate-dioxygenase [Phialophora attinorum]
MRSIRPYASATTQSPSLSITPVSGSLGAIINDVDISQTLSPTTIAAIRATFLDHGVIFFRQPKPLSPSAFLRFATCFGQPQRYPMVRGLDEHPEIIKVLKLRHETTNFGGIWHADTTYLPSPPLGTLLMAEEIPIRGGGDTLFANQYLAYETLSTGLQQTLSNLRGVSTSSKADASKTREDRIKDSAPSSAPEVFSATHPAVRTHPETGRKSLYVNVAHTSHFDGWTEAESAPLLKFLHEWQTKPEFTCRFKWEVGSLAFWDNRCVLHNPINDYQGEKREMMRITLAGDVPV